MIVQGARQRAYIAKKTRKKTFPYCFITGFSLTQKQHDSIMVVVDNLSKSAHFIPVKSTYKTIDVAEIFLKEIFRLHRVPKMVIYDRDVKFTSNF